MNKVRWKFSSIDEREYDVNTFVLNAVAVGTIDVAAAVASKKHVLIDAVLSAAAVGTVVVQDSTPTVLCGAE